MSSVTNMYNMFYQTSMSADNKLLTRCAWTGTSASASYGSIWGPGDCPSPPPSPPTPPPAPYAFTDKASLKTAAQEYNANAATATATYGPIADWDVSAVTDMSELFSGLAQFNADISSWDTSGVTTMYRMFNYATAFNQPLSFDTSRVTTMYESFMLASAFNQPLSFDTSSVTTMYYMFGDAYAFNQPLSFDTSSVTTMYAMVYYATAFNQPLSFDTSRVTNMGSMFVNTPGLSAANKLLTRCAWAATSAFASAGYGSSWGPGTCPTR